MGKKLLVKNLGCATDTAVLEKIFADYGAVLSAKVVTDNATGRSRGIVEMSSMAEADAALSALDGTDVGGQTIQVTGEVKPWAEPERVVNLPYPGRNLAKLRKNILLKSDDMQIMQFLIPAGAKIPTYQVQGEMILHCLAGSIDIIVKEESHRLEAGQLFCLALDSCFAVQGIKNASLLATMNLHKQHHSVAQMDG